MLFSWSERLEEPGRLRHRHARRLSGLRHPRRRGPGARLPQRLPPSRRAAARGGRRAIAASSSSAPTTAGATRATGGSTRRSISARDAAFDPDAWGLYAIDAEEWRGLVFLRLKRGGPGLVEWLGPIHDMAADYPLEQQHYFIVEGPRLRRSTGRPTARTTSNATIAGRCIPASARRWTSSNYRIDTYDEKFFHLHAPKRDGGLTRGLYFYRFPFLMLNLYDWGSSIATIEPLGPGPHPAHQLVFLHRRLARKGRGEPAVGRMVGPDRHRGPRHHHRRAAQPRMPASTSAARCRRNTNMR